MAFDEVADGRFSELLRAFRENGPTGAITIRRWGMINGRHHQAERAHPGVGHKSGFLDDPAETPRYWHPKESRPAGPWPPTAVPAVHLPRANLLDYATAAIASAIKQQLGRAGLDDFSLLSSLTMEVTL